jgi:hypothetical protein
MGTRLVTRLPKSSLDPTRILSGLAPRLFTKFPQNPFGLAAIFPFFLILGYKNRRPMFPPSSRLVLASHYTITFALIVQSYSSNLFSIPVQHHGASIQIFYCIPPFCCQFFSKYCFTVARSIPTVSTCSMVADH